MKIVAEGVFRAESDDGGRALIAEMGGDEASSPDTCSGVFFRVHSWDASRIHAEHRQFEGRRVRITLEVVEDITD